MLDTTRMFYLQALCFNAVVHLLWCENVREIKSLHPVIISVIKIQMHHRASLLLAADSSANRIVSHTGRGRRADNRDAGMLLFKQEFSLASGHPSLEQETESLCSCSFNSFWKSNGQWGNSNTAGWPMVKLHHSLTHSVSHLLSHLRTTAVIGQLQ